MRRVLGIDVASSSWKANGSALIEYDEAGFGRVVPGAIVWPSGPLTPIALADAIDKFARAHAVDATALDGPQGWRSPDTPAGTPGVGRRSEYECSTQGKTGVYPVTYPSNQRPWIEFSIQLFDALLARPGVVLADLETTVSAGAGYAVLECFPTSTWRTSGLTPLPGKGKRPALPPFSQALATAYGLPAFVSQSHDDLQAMVAALAAVAVIGGPALPIRRGVAATMTAGASGTRRLEGFIWDAKPKGVGSPPNAAEAIATSPSPPPSATASAPSEVVVYVTRRVLDHVNRTADPKQAQIAIKSVAGATAIAKRRVTLTVEGNNYALIIGDSHAVWPTHQSEETTESFEQLFAVLADRPDEKVAATSAVVEGE